MSRTTTKIVIARKDGTVAGQYFLGQGEHLIGREIDCAIYIDDQSVSREHARLIISADAIEIEDLDSTSGTYLDGVRLRGRIPMQPGQKLWISDLYIDIERQGFGGLVEGSRLGSGRFTLKRELGKGGMGAVWLALDEEVQENVALKLVSGHVGLDSESLNDLQREVNKSHHLIHPNIVRMGYFWNETGEPAFISLEYVEGTDLHQIRTQATDGILRWEEVQDYMLQLCDALEYAHSQKVAHRDIKPSNFMIDLEGKLKLADFGIAASLASTTMTFTSQSVMGAGTPLYMSPQQLDGQRPKVTDDIYSVGATFYELLTGTAPFHQGDVSYQVRHKAVTPMTGRLKELGLVNDIPGYVNTIVMNCLDKGPAQRPQSMRVIRDWIESSNVTLAQKKPKRRKPEPTVKTPSQSAINAPKTTKKVVGLNEKVNPLKVDSSESPPGLFDGGSLPKNDKNAASHIQEQLDNKGPWLPHRQDIVRLFPDTPDVFTTECWNKWHYGIDAAISTYIFSEWWNKFQYGIAAAISSYIFFWFICMDPIVYLKLPLPGTYTSLVLIVIITCFWVIVAYIRYLDSHTVVRFGSNALGLAIRKELKTTGGLTKADLRKVVSLELVGQQLNHVPKGLEKLTQLTRLSLEQNQIKDVTGLEKLTKLRTLYLGANQLTELPKGLEKLTQLTDLYLYNNQLTDVPKDLEKLTQLKTLWLHGNLDLAKAQITELKKALPWCIIYSTPRGK